MRAPVISKTKPGGNVISINFRNFAKNKLGTLLDWVENGDAPDRIVSYLRSHPQTNHVVLSVSNALGAGLPAALRAAGLADKVEIVGQSGDSQTFQDLQSGNIKAVVPYDYYTVDYLMLDALARHFAGAPLADGQPPLWTVTAENMPEAATKGLFPVVPSYRDEFKKLWGKQ